MAAQRPLPAADAGTPCCYLHRRQLACPSCSPSPISIWLHSIILQGQRVPLQPRLQGAAGQAVCRPHGGSPHYRRRSVSGPVGADCLGADSPRQGTCHTLPLIPVLYHHRRPDQTRNPADLLRLSCLFHSPLCPAAAPPLPILPGALPLLTNRMCPLTRSLAHFPFSSHHPPSHPLPL